MTYTYKRALKDSTEYFGGNELAARVTVDKYLLKNSENKPIESTPTDMHWRLANEFARIEKKRRFLEAVDIQSFKNTKGKLKKAYLFVLKY